MSEKSHLDSLISAARTAITSAQTLEELGQADTKYLGRKGELSAALRGLKDLNPEARREDGAKANTARVELEALITERKATFASDTRADFDYTLPGVAQRIGRLHPLTRTLDRMVDTFSRMGYGVATGPEVESDYYNFEALNFPPDHPARDMQDTFYLGDAAGLPPGMLLRTHTSNVQIREFKRRTPPFKIIAPGRVYRHEAISARSYCVFHQVEGFEVGAGVSMAHLKAALLSFCRDLFSPDVRLRLRPSFFPFTEPSAEVDITCILCSGKGCQLCKYEGWLEILGCGMIHPNVLTAVGYDPEEVSGYAFGMGVERIAMLKHGVPDIRLFYENDIRFTRQFQG